MRDDEAPGPSTQASAPKAPGRLGRADARNFGGGTLLDDLQAHRSRRAFDHLHGSLGLESVEVLALGLDDLPDLLLGDPADLLAIWLRRSFLDAGGALEQVHRGRSLEDEGERAVLEDRDLSGDDIARLRSRALVVGLRELHDVDAMGPQGGAHGWSGRRSPSLQLELEHGANLLFAHEA